MSNKDIITFKDQEVYKNNCSFKRAMRDLHNKKIVLTRQMRDGNEYKLSDMGKTLGLILNEIRV